MSRVGINVSAKQGQSPSERTWERFLLRLMDVTNDLAAEFPELTLGVPVVQRSSTSRKPRRATAPDPYDPTTDDGTTAHDGLDMPSYGD
jgi:hypothetical protein